jgi:hypothetical protein
MMAKIGADKNYFMLTYPLLALVLVREVSRIWEGAAPLHVSLREALLWGLAIPLAVTPTLIGLSSLRSDLRFAISSWSPAPIIRVLNGAAGPILTNHPFIPMAVGMQPTVLDYFAYTALERNGLLDAEPLRRRIEERRFPFVVLDAHVWFGVPEEDAPGAGRGHGMFFDGFLPLVRRHYAFAAQAGSMVILRPAPPGQRSDREAHR